MSLDAIDLADAVAAAIQGAWNGYSSPPAAGDAVTRLYEVSVGDPDFWENLTGRQVYVFPGKYETEMASRSEDYRDHVVSVLAAERYVGASARPPVAWLDARVRWAQACVWRPLDNRRLLPIGAAVWPISAEVTVYDAEELIQRKLFMTFVQATLRELLTNTPP